MLSRQGQQGWNQLFDLLQAELAARPADAHVNVKLVQLFNQDGRLEEAVKHCLATEKRGLLRHSVEWYTVVLHTLQVRPLKLRIFKTKCMSIFLYVLRLSKSASMQIYFKVF